MGEIVWGERVRPRALPGLPVVGRSQSGWSLRAAESQVKALLRLPALAAELVVPGVRGTVDPATI